MEDPPDRFIQVRVLLQLSASLITASSVKRKQPPKSNLNSSTYIHTYSIYIRKCLLLFVCEGDRPRLVCEKVV